MRNFPQRRRPCLPQACRGGRQSLPQQSASSLTCDFPQQRDSGDTEHPFLPMEVAVMRSKLLLVGSSYTERDFVTSDKSSMLVVGRDTASQNSTASESLGHFLAS